MTTEQRVELTSEESDSNSLLLVQLASSRTGWLSAPQPRFVSLPVTAQGKAILKFAPQELRSDTGLSYEYSMLVPPLGVCDRDKSQWFALGEIGRKFVPLSPDRFEFVDFAQQTTLRSSCGVEFRLQSRFADLTNETIAFYAAIVESSGTTHLCKKEMLASQASTEIVFIDKQDAILN